MEDEPNAVVVRRAEAELTAIVHRHLPPAFHTDRLRVARRRRNEPHAILGLVLEHEAAVSIRGNDGMDARDFGAAAQLQVGLFAAAN